MNPTDTVIIIGGSTGLGRQLALLYAERGCRVQISGRRTEKLQEVRNRFPERITCYPMDITDTEVASRTFDRMMDDSPEIGLIIVSAGTGDLNPNLDFGTERPTLLTNVVGWTNVVDRAFNRLTAQGHGQLAVITSVGGLRGSGDAPAYNASKAYQMNYMEGLRQRAYKSHAGICLTDIRPGLVDTAMAKGEGLFWVMPVEKTARQILHALDHRRETAVVTHRWRLIAFLLRHLPAALYKRM